MPTSKDDAGVDDVCVPGIGLVSIPGMKKRESGCIPKHIHFTSYHLVSTVVHVDTVVVVVIKQAGCVTLLDRKQLISALASN